MIHVDYATIVLFIESMNSYAEAALNLPSNEEYMVEPVAEEVLRVSPASREGTPFVTPSKAVCAIHLTSKPYDPIDGWVFGSDEDHCDFQLSANKKVGVSGRHFRMHFNWTSKRLLLTNLSKHHTMMSSPRLGRDIIVRDSRVLPLDEAIVVTAGAVCLSIHLPDRGERQRAFDEALDAYHDDVRQAIPRLAGLGFNKSVAETPLVVLGKRNRVQYIIEKEGDVGSGAFGIVSKALDSITGNLYAAKRFTKISPSVGTTLKEIDIHRKTSHEHIVRVVDVQDDLPLLIMEYVPLGNLLQQERFSRSETVIMFEQQLKAIKYLHGSGITHRDIKPENILVESRYPNLNTKLSDFGLSSDRFQLKTFCGTRLYVAPEVWRKGTQYTNAVDIWSLGVVGLQLAYSLPRQLCTWNEQDWTDEVHYHARKQTGRFATLLQNMLLHLPSARLSAERCLTDMLSWNSLATTAPLQAARPKRNVKSPSTQIPKKSIREARNHQPIDVPQIRAHPGKPLHLFGAISSEHDLRTNGEPTKEQQNTEDSKAPNHENAKEDEEDEDAEILGLETRDVEGGGEEKVSRKRGTARQHFTGVLSVPLPCIGCLPSPSPRSLA